MKGEEKKPGMKGLKGRGQDRQGLYSREIALPLTAGGTTFIRLGQMSAGNFSQ